MYLNMKAREGNESLDCVGWYEMKENVYILILQIAFMICSSCINGPTGFFSPSPCI